MGSISLAEYACTSLAERYSNAHKINLKGESMRKLRSKAPKTREEKYDTERTD